MATATIDELAPSYRAHASAETMGVFAAAIARLISTFHGYESLNFLCILKASIIMERAILLNPDSMDWPAMRLDSSPGARVS